MLNRFGQKIRKLLTTDSSPSPFLRLSSIYESIPLHMTILYALLAYRAIDMAPFEIPAIQTIQPPTLFFFLKYYSNELLITNLWLTPVFLILAACFPRKKIIGILGLLLFIQMFAVGESFAISDNGHRPMVWMAIVLLFMPSLTDSVSRIKKLKTVNHYWFSLLALNSCYVLAGLWKLIWGGILQPFNGTGGIWNLQAVGYIIAEYDVKTGQGLPLTGWFIEHAYILWLPYVISVFIEFSFWIVFFRPSLWRVYAAGAMFMHIGTRLTLNITFETMFLIAGVLNLASPFYAPKGFVGTLTDLPIIHWMVKRSKTIVNS